MILVESGDKCVREAAPVLKTGRKRSAKKSVVEAKAALQIGDIVGQVQHGRGGFGLSLAPPKWHKAGLAQRRKLVVNEVRKQKERMRCIMAIYRDGIVWNNASWAGKTFGQWKRVG